MKEEQKKYLNSVGIKTNALIGRITDLLELCKKIVGEEPEDILIGEYQDEDGIRQYEYIDLYTKSYLFGIKDFIKRNFFLITPSNRRIHRITFKAENYDFTEATTTSKLTVGASTSSGDLNEMKATGSNCDHLLKIIYKYYKPFLEY